jgi:hypothetical protein
MFWEEVLVYDLDVGELHIERHEAFLYAHKAVDKLQGPELGC